MFIHLKRTDTQKGTFTFWSKSSIQQVLVRGLQPRDPMSPEKVPFSPQPVGKANSKGAEARVMFEGYENSLEPRKMAACFWVPPGSALNHEIQLPTRATQASHVEFD